MKNLKRLRAIKYNYSRRRYNQSIIAVKFVRSLGLSVDYSKYPEVTIRRCFDTIKLIGDDHQRLEALERLCDLLGDEKFQ